MNRRERVAIVENHIFHAETVFAFAYSVRHLGGSCDLTVFAPARHGSREFLREDLQVEYSWHPFSDFSERTLALADRPPYDLVIVNTFPSSAGRQAMELTHPADGIVLGLVHDIHFLIDPRGARSALEQHANLWLAHAGVATPVDAGLSLSPELQRRIVRFLPVFHFPVEPDVGRNADVCQWQEQRTGVALPGTIDFGCRDYSTAVRLAVESGIPLKIFGWGIENIECQRLANIIAAHGSLSSIVSVLTNVSYREFYRAVYNSRFVAVMTVNQEYLAGKLTGAVTAAVSCGVPMLARGDVHKYYTVADPAVFLGCMVAFDPLASSGRGDDWGSLASGMSPELYRDLCIRTARAREILLAENATTIERVMEE